MLSNVYVPTIFALSTLAVSASPFEPRTNSPPAAQNGNYYTVPGLGKFNTHLSVDFTKVSSVPSSLIIDTDLIDAGPDPYSHQFTKNNVVINQGDSVSLIVPGGQTSSPLTGAEFRTAYDDIKYASVRTVAKASSAAGACHGFFFYLNDNQESDIEILTSDSNELWFTNQALTAGGQSSSKQAASPGTITSAYHEYRLDWVKGRTDYYVDGVLKKTITANVPNKAGSWVWNNWSSGGEWTQGPPTARNDLRIQSINAYFNRTSVA